MSDTKMVTCGLCSTPTHMTGTNRCDTCWELETRVLRNPRLARRILAGYDAAALDHITQLLSATEWNADTSAQIVDIIRGTGRTIEDVA